MKKNKKKLIARVSLAAATAATNNWWRHSNR